MTRHICRNGYLLTSTTITHSARPSHGRSDDSLAARRSLGVAGAGSQIEMELARWRAKYAKNTTLTRYGRERAELRVPHHSANSFQGGITSPTHPTALPHRHVWPKGPTWIGGSIGATGFRAMASVLWGGLVLGASDGQMPPPPEY